MSMYKALYRTYRPNSFAKIVGQEHIVTTFKNTIMQQKIVHAYLFHGPRGTGKTSIAKIFAAAVNCTAKGSEDKPCHKCRNCELIDSGQATDIIELDAASNNGVDEIRQIREFARYAPTHLPYKVYIIDEVHMLSTAAFNALLKTLEEPPAHVIFILATTEIHKIPPTIISRCQRSDFKKVSTSEIITGIKPILRAENIKMSAEALEYLAEYADGGMRDALSVLDQVRVYATKKIELQDLHEVIGSVGQELYVNLMHAVLAKDVQTILRLLDGIVASGKNVQLFIEGFLEYLLHEVEQSFQGTTTFDSKTLFLMLEKINQLAAQMRAAFLPHIALQAVFLELAYEQQNAHSVEELIPQQSSKQKAEDMDVAKVDAAVPQCEENGGTAISDSVNTSSVDVLDLYNADNFVADEVKVVEVPIKDEVLARESLGRAMDEAVVKMKTAKMTVADAVPPDEQTEEELTTIFDEIAKEQKGGAAPRFQPGQDTSEHEAQVQKLEQINRERHCLLLWRAMAEVVLYPEYNQLEKIKRKWQTLKFDPSNQIVVMLLDMEPKIATKKEIVLSSFNKALTNQLQMERNKSVAEAFISELVGQAYEIIIIDEGQWMRERNRFSQDWKVGKVSEATIDALAKEVMSLEEQAKAQGLEYVALDFYEEGSATTKEEEEPIVQEAINMFGADIVEVK